MGCSGEFCKFDKSEKRPECCIDEYDDCHVTSKKQHYCVDNPDLGRQHCKRTCKCCDGQCKFDKQELEFKDWTEYKNMVPDVDITATSAYKTGVWSTFTLDQCKKECVDDKYSFNPCVGISYCDSCETDKCRLYREKARDGDFTNGTHECKNCKASSIADTYVSRKQISSSDGAKTWKRIRDKELPPNGETFGDSKTSFHECESTCVNDPTCNAFAHCSNGKLCKQTGCLNSDPPSCKRDACHWKQGDSCWRCKIYKEKINENELKPSTDTWRVIDVHLKA